MNLQSLAINIVFILGILFQSFLLLKNKFDAETKAKLFFCLLPGLFLYFTVFFGNPNPSFLFLIIFSIFFAGFFMKRALPRINESTVLAFTLIFWYLFLSYYNLFLPVVRIPLLILALIFTVGVFIISFTEFQIGIFWKIFYYVWFLIINLFIICSYLFVTKSIVLLPSVMEASNFTLNSSINIFLIGMVFLLVGIYFFSFILIFPMHSRGESYEETFKRCYKYRNILIKKFSNYQIQWRVSILIILILSGIFLLNHYFEFMTVYLLVNLTIISIFYLLPKTERIEIK